MTKINNHHHPAGLEWMILRKIPKILLGGIFMSFVGVLLRQIDTADAFQILFYRSIGLSAIVAVLACLHRRSRPGAFLASLGRPEWFAGVLLGFAFSFYIYSMLNTTVANTLFILSIAPFFAALLGWCLIGERPTIVTWLAMGWAESRDTAAAGTTTSDTAR